MTRAWEAYQAMRDAPARAPLTRENFGAFFTEITAPLVAERDAALAAQAEALRDAHVDQLDRLTWDDYVGQERARAELQVRIRSALKRNAPLPHILLVAGPGTGKSTIARLIAQEADKPLIEMTRPPKNADALIDALWGFEAAGGVLFVDEVHGWSTSTQHLLMSLMEEGVIEGSGGRVPYPDVTVVAATTEEDKLFHALLSRFGVKPKFVDYTDDDMGTVIAGMCERSDVDLDPETLAALGRASAGNPRSARHLVEAARDLACNDLPTDARSVLAFAGVAPDGLTEEHLGYLAKLASQPNGKAGLETMRTVLGKSTEQIRRIEKVLEPRGLMVIGGASGRSITTEGRGRLARGVS